MSDKVKIKIENGQIVEATAPVIISASRSTDIPAFYSKWLIYRLKKGYVIWYNPFNRKSMYISFQNTKAIVFWSKNPAPLIPYLKELDNLGIQYYFQYTLNDYEPEGLEPNIPPLDERISTFLKLSSLIGKEKVIWRFDPIIITKITSPRTILKRIWNIGNSLKGSTEKLVFSFIDINFYRKVQNNLVKETNLFTKKNIESSELNKYQIEEIIQGLTKIKEAWAKEGWDIKMSTCAENIDIGKYDIEHNSCIDGELMKHIFEKNQDLSYYLNFGKLPEKTLFDTTDIKISLAKKVNLKDKGQRKYCGCIKSKDIGMYNTCSHHCVYCYANTSREVVETNTIRHDYRSESLISKYLKK